jgi:phage-related minor tail protein
MIIEKILSGIKSAANSIYALVKSIIDKIKAMFNALKITLNIPGVTGGGGSTGGGSGGSHTTGGTGGAGQQQRAIGGSVFSGRQYLIGEHGPELFTPSMGGYITPNNKLAMEGMSGGGLVINLTYAPAVSLASEAELEQHLMPVILKGVRQARRGY